MDEFEFMKLQYEFEFMKDWINLYKINKKGQIWSCRYNKIMKTHISKDGYLKIKVHKNHCSIHRLLGIQYIPNPLNLLEIDHIDRNKLNNSLENLRWVDRITNANNKTTNLSNLTVEELALKKEKLKKYKTEWAQKNRLKNGHIPKVSKTVEELKESAKIRRKNMPQEKRDEINKKRRELRIC